MADIQPITSLEKFKELVERNDAAFLIELYAPWCTRCKKLESALLNSAPKCDMYKINIDAEPFIDETAFESITSLPCVWVYKAGRKTEFNNPTVDNINAFIDGRQY